MATDERKDPRYKECKEEYYINYSLAELWELIDNIRTHCRAYKRSQREPSNKRKAKNEIKIEL